MATAKWCQKHLQHKSAWTRQQRVITTRSARTIQTEFRKQRYHVTEKERKQYGIVCRPGSSYRAAKRNMRRVERRMEKRPRSKF